jgi:hypothetical protein
MARNETRARFSGVLFATGLRRNTASWREADVRREALHVSFCPKRTSPSAGACRTRLKPSGESRRRAFAGVGSL